jgi:hypothetical protein
MVLIKCDDDCDEYDDEYDYDDDDDDDGNCDIHYVLSHHVPSIDPNDCELVSLLLILHHANIVANSINTGSNGSTSSSSSSSSLYLVNVTQAVQLKGLDIDYEYILRQCRYYKRYDFNVVFLCPIECTM